MHRNRPATMRKGGSFLGSRAKISSTPPFRVLPGLLCLCGRQIRAVQLAGVEARALAAQHGRDIEALKQRLKMRLWWRACEQPIDEAVRETDCCPQLQRGVIAAGLAQQRRAGRRPLREYNRRGR